MPRVIVGEPVTRTGDARAQAAPSASKMTGAALAARLRERRSPKYVEAMARLDAGTHQHDRAALDALLDTIGSEFPELGVDQRPLGIVGKCYLGEPYEVHRCDLDGNIVEHFERHRDMPPPFERARSLAAHGAYAFIEIYYDSIRAIAPDGSVAVL